MSKYCRNFKAILVANQDEKTRLLVRSRCKQWSCPACAENNQKMWRGFLWRRVNELGLSGWVFITITSHKNAQKSSDFGVRGTYTMKNIRSGTNKLFKRLKRIFGNYSYVRVYERHAKGGYHVHIIARVGALPDRMYHYSNRGKRTISKNPPKSGKYGRWLPKTTIKNIATECGLGNQADIQAIPDDSAGKVISYVLKYMTKKALGTEEMKGVRRVQVSQDFGKNEPDDSDLLWFVRVGIHELDLAQYDVYDLNEKRFITIFDLNEAGYYPDYEESEDNL